MVMHIDLAKMQEHQRGAFHYPDFMGPTISHMFLVLSTQWMSSP